MEIKPTQPAGYTIKQITLLESSFKRELEIPFEQSLSISNDLNISSESAVDFEDNHFTVVTELNLIGKQEQTNFYVFKVRMSGTFERIGEPELKEEVFKRLNAPAIIYPFIREHVYNLALKSGIGNVIIPPVNFKV